MTVTNTVEKIKKFYQEELPTGIPFENHPLKDASEYAKELYCTMLATILQYKNEPLREQLIFLGQIIKGVGLESSIQHFIKKAKMIDVDFAKEFYEEFVDQPFAKNFVVDALVMTNARENVNGKQLEFLVEVVDVLGIEEEEFQKLIQIALSILKHSSIDFSKIVFEELDLKYLDHFKYFPLVHELPNYLYGKNAEKYTELKEIQEFMSSEKEILIFENCYFNSEVNIFDEKLLVIFKNCYFNGFAERCFFSNIKNLIFEKCIFESFKNSIRLDKVENILMFKCFVRDINIKSKSSFSSGFIESDDINLYLINNTFKNIAIKDSYLSFSTGTVVFRGNVRQYDISRNIFKNCKYSGEREKKSFFRFWNSNSLYEDRLIKGHPFKEFVNKNYGVTLGNNYVAKNEIINSNIKELIISE